MAETELDLLNDIRELLLVVAYWCLHQIDAELIRPAAYRAILAKSQILREAPEE